MSCKFPSSCCGQQRGARSLREACLLLKERIARLKDSSTCGGLLLRLREKDLPGALHSGEVVKGIYIKGCTPETGLVVFISMPETAGHKGDNEHQGILNELGFTGRTYSYGGNRISSEDIASQWCCMLDPFV